MIVRLAMQRITRRSSVVVALACALVTQSVGAQEWRTLESSRQLGALTGKASVRVEYAAGTIDLRPTVDAFLYRTKLTYDAERSQPIATFDETTRTVTIGTRSASSNWSRGTKEGSTFRAELTRNLPLRLSLELGAAKGDIQLGGLRLQELSLATGATKLHIDFSEPNRELLARFDLDVGAAEVAVTHAGNARASRTKVNIGVGSLDYDLDGQWEGDMDLSVNLALGKFTLRVPADVGVRVNAHTFLIDFARTGLEKRGSAWYSAGHDSAKRHVTIQLSAAFGEFNLVHR